MSYYRTPRLRHIENEKLEISRRREKAQAIAVNLFSGAQLQTEDNSATAPKAPNNIMLKMNQYLVHYSSRSAGKDFRCNQHNLYLLCGKPIACALLCHLHNYSDAPKCSAFRVRPQLLVVKSLLIFMLTVNPKMTLHSQYNCIVCRVIVTMRPEFADDNPQCTPRNKSRTAAHPMEL
jgi:hypothetical protein